MGPSITQRRLCDCDLQIPRVQSPIYREHCKTVTGRDLVSSDVKEEDRGAFVLLFRNFSKSEVHRLEGMDEVSAAALVSSLKPEMAPPTHVAPTEAAGAADEDTGGEVGVSDMDKDLFCPICMQIIKDAFLTACGHSFCYMCIITHLQNKTNCPCCGVYLSSNQLFPNRLLEKVGEFFFYLIWHGFCLVAERTDKKNSKLLKLKGAKVHCFLYFESSFCCLFLLICSN